MDTLSADLRYAFRSVRARPGLALVAVVSIGVGIAATTSVFSAADALIRRPPPGVHAERSVEVGRTDDGSGFDSFTYPDFRDLRAARTGLDDVAAYNHASFSYAGSEGGYGIVAYRVARRTRELGIRVALGAGRRDPVALLGVGAFVAAMVLCGSLVPALRAGRGGAPA